MSKVFIGAFAIDLLAGKLIEQGTSGDKAKQGARATKALAIINGLDQILAGDAADGINAIAGVAQADDTLSAGEQRAVRNLITLAGQEAALLSNVAGGTILGQAGSAILQNALDEVVSVCQDYIKAAPPAVS